MSHFSEIKTLRGFGALVVGLGFAVFALFALTNHDGAFVLDDYSSILENPYVTSFDLLSPGSWWRAAFDSPATFRPIPNLTFAVQWALWGESRVAFHLLNDLLHVGAWGALFFLLSECLWYVRQDALGGLSRLRLALLGATLWAIHPIQTSTVTYAVQRMTVLSAGFSFLSMAFYLRARRTNRRSFYGASAGAYLPALFSKEIACVVPILIALWEWFIGPKEEEIAHRRRWVGLGLACVPPFLIAIGYAALSDGHFALGKLPNRDFTLLERWLTAPRVYWNYVQLLIAPPVRQILSYDSALSRSMLVPWTTVPAFSALAAALSVGWRIRAKFPWATFCIWGFVAALAPESTFLNLELLFEHRLYLPSALVIPPLVIGATIWARKAEAVKPAIAAIGLLSILWVGLLVNRNLGWRSEVSLWENNVEATPNNFAAVEALGIAELREGRGDEALTTLNRALALRPESSDAHYNLGLALLQKGRSDDAAKSFERALSLNPKKTDAYIHLALMAESKGDDTRALSLYEQALTRSPNSYAALFNSAALLAEEGRFQEAVSRLEILAKTNPKDAELQYRLARFCELSGSPSIAKNKLRHACKLGKSEACELLQSRGDF